MCVFLSRESVVAGNGLASRRDRRFAFMAHNALSATAFSQISRDRRIELGSEVEICIEVSHVDHPASAEHACAKHSRTTASLLGLRRPDGELPACVNRYLPQCRSFASARPTTCSPRQ
ncbi:hypothetical protein B0E47_01310 [Rhodanobacter sp. B05]|nr:hypothetical protein B0E47_01310 [Rhodanobacter sp. B05]